MELEGKNPLIKERLGPLTKTRKTGLEKKILEGVVLKMIKAMKKAMKKGLVSRKT